MGDMKRVVWLMLVCVGLSVVYGEEKPEGQARGLFDDLFEGMDVNIQHAVNQGSSVIQKVQEMKGQHGTQIIKTEITQYTSGNSGNFPVGGRFKRGLFDAVLDDTVNKMNYMKDKVAGVVTDAANIGYDELHKLKGKVQNRLE